MSQLALRALIPVLAVGATFSAQANPISDDPLAWLQRAAASARTASYSGTFVHTNGERTSSFRISHMIVNGAEHERIEPLEGPPQEIVRRNDEMFCYFPDSKTVRLDRRVSARFFPSIFRAPPEVIAENYSPKLGKVQRVMGYECQWVRLEPKDALRFAQRLCSELTTGLVVRSLTVDAQNKVIEQYFFTDLKLGPQVARSDVKPSFSARLKQWVTDAKPREESKAVDTGWSVTNAPAGYRQVSEIRRTMPGRTQPVSQLVLTDGIASMSVFVEAAGSPARAEAANVDGTTSFFVRPAGDHVITVLGEVPLAAAQQVGRSVARRP
jgi:sigma-E factor negative regulatory protein RseB